VLFEKKSAIEKLHDAAFFAREIVDDCLQAGAQPLGKIASIPISEKLHEIFQVNRPKAFDM